MDDRIVEDLQHTLAGEAVSSIGAIDFSDVGMHPRGSFIHLFRPVVKK